ncbi:hypothetical protein K438DRAFT_1768419 [Mycena galopus ATCC 62051]|nr:hypothetical protein K438DRAFT_1768406 [Mycena galopus ATCC 62051]KAF8180512.1 hypothetical protein K438DRAFT_1768419 [Mycena galopus ATCC 62051]
MPTSCSALQAVPVFLALATRCMRRAAPRSLVLHYRMMIMSCGTVQSLTAPTSHPAKYFFTTGFHNRESFCVNYTLNINGAFPDRERLLSTDMVTEARRATTGTWTQPCIGDSVVATEALWRHNYCWDSGRLGSSHPELSCHGGSFCINYTLNIHSAFAARERLLSKDMVTEAWRTTTETWTRPCIGDSVVATISALGLHRGCSTVLAKTAPLCDVARCCSYAQPPSDRETSTLAPGVASTCYLTRSVSRASRIYPNRQSWED